MMSVSIVEPQLNLSEEAESEQNSNCDPAYDSHCDSAYTSCGIAAFYTRGVKPSLDHAPDRSRRESLGHKHHQEQIRHLRCRCAPSGTHMVQPMRMQGVEEQYNKCIHGFHSVHRTGQLVKVQRQIHVCAIFKPLVRGSIISCPRFTVIVGALDHADIGQVELAQTTVEMRFLIGPAVA